jgi:nucleotide-binding universal stress UspA family protein
MSTDFRIVVAIDLKAGTDRLLAETQRYGLALNALVNIIHVASPEPDFVGYMKSGEPGEATQDNQLREAEAKALRGEHAQTQAFGEALRANGVRVDRALTLQGPILETILDETRKLGADLLILGSHHHGAIHRLWFGDIAADAAKEPPCALLVIPVSGEL